MNEKTHYVFDTNVIVSALLFKQSMERLNVSLVVMKIC